MTEVLFNALIALSAVILALVAFIRYYLPRHDRNMHNPWAEQLLQEMRAMHEANIQHYTREEAWQNEVRRTLERIEGKQ